MSPEERDIISRFVQRVSGSPAAGSVPATAAAPLPAVDPEADQHLSMLFQQFPEARYRMTQFAFGQEQALQGAAQHIQALEQQLAAARQGQMQTGTPAQAGGQPGAGQPGGFFSRLFGGPQQGQPNAPYSQPYQQPGPGYAQQQPGFGAPPPGYGGAYGGGYGQPGMMAQRGGSGFLGSALTTAAGVAGGMLAFNAIEGLFTDRGAESIGAGTFGNEQVGGFDQGGFNQGGADQSGWGNTPDQGAADNSGWQTLPDQSGGDDNSGWQDTSAPDDSGGGWDDSGGNSDWS